MPRSSRCEQNQAVLDTVHALSLLNDSALAPSAGASLDAQQKRLSTVIESDIIPRLLLAHRRSVADENDYSDLPVQVGAADVLAFAEILINEPYDRVLEHTERLIRGGLPIKRLLLDIMAPTAAHLGEMWSSDNLDFLAVTVGLSTLHRLVHEVSSVTLDEDAVSGPAILLAPAPGEQHVFGLLLVGELFRRAGWMVSGGVPAGPFDVVKAVRQHPYEVVGFTMSNERCSGDLRHLIGDVRRAACNPEMVVIVGGNIFKSNPALGASLGADLATTQADDAVGFASRHFARKRV